MYCVLVAPALYLTDCGFCEWWKATSCADALLLLCAAAPPPTVTQHQHHQRCRSALAVDPTPPFLLCLFVSHLPHGYHNQLSPGAKHGGRTPISSRDTVWQACHSRGTSISCVTTLHAALVSLARLSEETPLLFLSNRLTSLLRRSHPQQRAQRVKFSRVRIDTAIQPGGWMDEQSRSVGWLVFVSGSWEEICAWFCRRREKFLHPFSIRIVFSPSRYHKFQSTFWLKLTNLNYSILLWR